MSLIKDVVNNLDNKDYQNKINNVNYDLKSAEQFLLEIVRKENSENEARELHKSLIRPKVDKLANAKGMSKDKRGDNINISDNIESIIFDGCYYHNFDKPKSKTTEESIAERTQLRRKRLDRVKEKEKKTVNNKMFSYYFDYSSPSNMCSRLSVAKGEINKDQVYLIKRTLAKIKNIVKNVPKDDPLKTAENEKIIDIVEKILELNSENQLGLGLTILTPNQMRSRLPISLAQLKAGNYSVKLQNEIRQILYSLYRSKKLIKNVHESLVDII